VITFPAGRFSVAPIVTTALLGSSVLTDGPVTVNTITTTGANLTYNRGNAATFTVNWIAVQPG
jgi:hypothetical protein